MSYFPSFAKQQVAKLQPVTAVRVTLGAEAPEVATALLYNRKEHGTPGAPSLNMHGFPYEIVCQCPP